MTSPVGESSIRLDPTLLWEMGYRSLTKSQVIDVLDDIYDTLEIRVGRRVAEQLTTNQLATFDRILTGVAQGSPLKWLQQNVKNYRELVRAEYSYIVLTLQRAADLDRKTRTKELSPGGSAASPGLQGGPGVPDGDYQEEAR